MTLPPRKLPYSLRYVDYLVQDSVQPAPLPLEEQEVFPDAATSTDLIWNVNQEEWTRVFSALNFGADLAYPNCAIDTVAIFLRMVTNPVNICERIIECIDNDSDVQSALIQFLTNNGYPSGSGTPQAPLSASTLGENLLPEDYTCDNNHLFGMCMEIVGAIHENTTEIIQAIQGSAGDYLNLTNAVLDNVPAVETIGLVTEYINWVIDTVQTDYDTAWSTSVQQEIACRLFCAIKDDCEITFDDIFDAYKDISTLSTPSIDQLFDWIDQVFSGSLSGGSVTVALVDMVGLCIMRFGGKYVNWIGGLRSMQTTIALAEDATDSDWLILCDDCPSDGTLYDVLATGNPFTGVGLTSIDVNAGQTVTVTYVSDLWDYIQSPARFDGEGDIGNPAPSGSIRVGSPLCQLAYSPRPDNLNWLAGNNGFSYTFISSGQLLLAMVDGNSSSYTNNVGSIKVLVNITG